MGVKEIVEKARKLEGIREEVLLKRLSNGRVVIQKVLNPKTGNQFFRIHVFVNRKLKPIILIRDGEDIETLFELATWLKKRKKEVLDILSKLNGVSEVTERKEEEEELLA